jgi:hypothetical protein
MKTKLLKLLKERLWGPGISFPTRSDLQELTIGANDPAATELAIYHWFGQQLLKRAAHVCHVMGYKQTK